LDQGDDEQLRAEYNRYLKEKAKNEISTQTDIDQENLKKQEQEKKETITRTVKCIRARIKENRKLDSALNKAYIELADVTNNLTNSQIALQEEKTQKEDLELKVSELEEDNDYLNEQLNDELERTSELADEEKKLQEKLNQAKEIIRELAS